MDISAGISSLTTLVEMGGLLVKERDRQKAAALQIQFTEKLLESQAELLQLLGSVIDQQRHVAALEQRVRELDAASAEKERYVLAKLGAGREFFVYRQRPHAELVERPDEVEHFICQPCFELGKKLVLNGNGDGYWWCPGCKHGAQVSPRPMVSQGGRHSGGGWVANF